MLSCLFVVSQLFFFDGQDSACARELSRLQTEPEASAVGYPSSNTRRLWYEAHTQPPPQEDRVGPPTPGRSETSAILGRVGSRAPYPARHHHAAATHIQRCWRGHSARRRLWRLDGPATHFMTVRLQRAIRGYLGRQRAYRLAKTRLDLHVSKIQALYHGSKARRLTRFLRAERHSAAASRLQQAYRGYKAKRCHAAVWAAWFYHTARKIQKTWRMHMGRRRAEGTRMVRRQQDAKLRRLHDAFASGLLPKKTVTSKGAAHDESVEESLVETVSYLICCKHDYAAADKMILDALTQFSENVTLWYLRAILCKVMWTCVGCFRLMRRDVFDEGIYYLMRARRLDGPLRQGLVNVEETYLTTSLRQRQNHPLSILITAVAVQSAYCFGHGEDEGVPQALSTTSPKGLSRAAADRTRAELMMRMARRRCQRLYARLQALYTKDTANIAAAHERMFHDLFGVKGEVLMQRSKVFNGTATARGQAEDSARRVVRNSAGVQDVEVTVTILLQGSCLLVTGFEHQHEVRPIVVHDDEVQALTRVAVRAELKAGASEGELGGSDVLKVVAEYTFRNVELARASSSATWSPQNFHDPGQACLVLPLLLRMREENERQTLRTRACVAVQRVARGMLGRRKAKQWTRRANGIARCSTRLRDILKRLRLRRQMIDDNAARIQAQVRACLCWLRYRKQKSAAVSIQILIRYFLRKKRKELGIKRKLHGVEVHECFRGAVTLSGRPVVLVVKRAGLSFKLIAHDEEAGESYVGFVYEPAILEMLRRERNKVRRWQTDEVVEMLISKVALVDAVPALAAEFKCFGNKRTIVLHQEKGASLCPNGVCHVSMSRGLHDQYEVLRRYDRLLRRQRERRIMQQKVHSIVQSQIKPTA